MVRWVDGGRMRWIAGVAAVAAALSAAAARAAVVIPPGPIGGLSRSESVELGGEIFPGTGTWVQEWTFNPQRDPAKTFSFFFGRINDTTAQLRNIELIDKFGFVQCTIFAPGCGLATAGTWTLRATWLADGTEGGDIRFGITPLPAGVLLLAPALLGLGVAAHRRRTFTAAA